MAVTSPSPEHEPGLHLVAYDDGPPRELFLPADAVDADGNPGFNSETLHRLATTALEFGPLHVQGVESQDQKPELPTTFAGGMMVVDWDKADVQVQGEWAHLTKTEAQLLERLAERLNQHVPVPQLVDLLWPDQPYRLGTSSLRAYVHRLRGKLGPAGDLLQSRRHMGYILLDSLQ